VATVASEAALSFPVPPSKGACRLCLPEVEGDDGERSAAHDLRGAEMQGVEGAGAGDLGQLRGRLADLGS